MQGRTRSNPVDASRVAARFMTAREKAAGHGLTDPVLIALVRRKAKTLRIPLKGAPKVTPELRQAANAFIRGVSKALAVWVQTHPPEDGSTFAEVMNQHPGAAYSALLSLDDPTYPWDPLWNDPKPVASFLANGLDREYQALTDALTTAAQGQGA